MSALIVLYTLTLLEGDFYTIFFEYDIFFEFIEPVFITVTVIGATRVKLYKALDMSKPEAISVLTAITGVLYLLANLLELHISGLMFSEDIFKTVLQDTSALMLILSGLVILCLDLITRTLQSVS